MTISRLDAGETAVLIFYADSVGCSRGEAARRVCAAMKKHPDRSLTIGEWFDLVENERLTRTTESVA